MTFWRIAQSKAHKNEVLHLYYTCSWFISCEVVYLFSDESINENVC